MSELKSVIPPRMRSAIDLVDERLRVRLMVQAVTKYRLSDADFSWILTHCSNEDLVFLAQDSSRFDQVWKHTIANLAFIRIKTVLNIALIGKRIDDALQIVKDALTVRSLSDEDSEACLKFIESYLIGKIKVGSLDEQDTVLGELYLSKSTKSLNVHFVIASALKNLAYLELLWRREIIKEAGIDTSDFGEDDDRDTRLERLYIRAVEQLPHLKQDLAEFSVQALQHRGRKMLAGRLAKRLGLTEHARALFLEVRMTKLAKDKPFDGWDRHVVAESSYLAGEYEAAYGYYLVIGDKYGMFKSAWEFDRPRAIAIAREIANETLNGDNSYLDGSLEIVRQAGLPEAASIYEKAINCLEQRGTLKEALEYARAQGDTVRITRYQLLMTL